MKIYFTASARGKGEFGQYYKQIYDAITQLGHTNVDEFVFKVDAEDLYRGSHDDQVKLYNQAVRNIRKSDLVLLEVSMHSLSMGFVMQRALEDGKPVVAFFLRGHEPYFALGVENEKLQVLEYQENNLKQIIEDAIEYAQGQMDTRFNFFISPKIGAYLDVVVKKQRLPRAVYLRRLIEEDMKQNKYHA